MSINERLKLIITTLGLNNNSLAKKIGVSPTVTHNVLSGRLTKPSYELLEKILFTFDNINSEWLLRERGEMFIGEDQKNSSRDHTDVLEEQLREMTQMNRELIQIISMYAKKEHPDH